MVKLLKLTLIIAALLSVLYYGGAYLLPSKQYFTKTILVPLDPVAAYSKLVLADQLRFGKDDQMEISLSLSDTMQYEEIHFNLHPRNEGKILNAGYYLREAKDGTHLIWYLELDSLSYPRQRWEGFLSPLIYRNNIRKYFEEFEQNLSR